MNGGLSISLASTLSCLRQILNLSQTIRQMFAISLSRPPGWHRIDRSKGTSQKVDRINLHPGRITTTESQTMLCIQWSRMGIRRRLRHMASILWNVKRGVQQLPSLTHCLQSRANDSHIHSQIMQKWCLDWLMKPCSSSRSRYSYQNLWHVPAERMAESPEEKHGRSLSLWPKNAQWLTSQEKIRRKRNRY